MKKLITGMMLWCSMAVLLGGCQPAQSAGEDSGEVVIPVMFRIDPSTDQGQYQEMVEGFNEAYRGTYRLEVEWVTATEQGYRERIKVMNALDELPAVITDVAFNAELYENMADNGRFVDLKPYMEESGEWSKLLEEADMESLSWENGEIYLSPISSGLYSSAGIFYNKELFAEAGITDFPETWEEFFFCLEELQNAGVEPLALHGGGTYWEAMLFATAYMASEPEGKEFLLKVLPDSYCNEEVERMLACVETLYDYTYEDALELEFSDAAERFYNGEAAIIANGFWMLEEMPLEVQEHTGFAPFPGNCMMVSREMSSWAVISGYGDEVTEGAVEFLKYRYLNSQTEEEEMTSLEHTYKEVYGQIGDSIPNYQLKWKDQIQNDFFAQMIPKLLEGTITREEFLRQMDEQ